MEVVKKTSLLWPWRHHRWQLLSSDFCLWRGVAQVHIYRLNCLTCLESKNRTSAIRWIFPLTFTCPPQLEAHMFKTLDCPCVICKCSVFIFLHFYLSAYFLISLHFSLHLSLSLWLYIHHQLVLYWKKLSFPLRSQSYTSPVTYSPTHRIHTSFKESLTHSAAHMRASGPHTHTHTPFFSFPLGDPIADGHTLLLC